MIIPGEHYHETIYPPILLWLDGHQQPDTELYPEADLEKWDTNRETSPSEFTLKNV